MDWKMLNTDDENRIRGSHGDAVVVDPAVLIDLAEYLESITSVVYWGCSYSFVNWAMLFSRLNRDMLTPGLSADGLQSVRSASTRRRRAPCPA